jgi:aerobic carbon-monoxide dehydrogenase small subunit
MPEKVSLSLTINGTLRTVRVPPEFTLVETLRTEAGLSGTKEGCGEGECGACSVLLDGKLVNSCLVLAAECDGAEVLTIEGLAEAGRLHPVQDAFVKNGAIQCGFCTPGMIMTCYALLQENSSPTEEEIRRAFEGNLCRCTGYRKIVDAVGSAARALQNPGSSERGES